MTELLWHALAPPDSAFVNVCEGFGEQYENDRHTEDWTDVSCAKCLEHLPVPDKCPACEVIWASGWLRSEVSSGALLCTCGLRYDLKLTSKGLVASPQAAVQASLECPSCASKPGSPTLCTDCLKRRAVWDKPKPDPVNSPAHYMLADGLEVLDVIEMLPGALPTHHKCCALKYIMRAGRKGGSDTEVQDLEKAVKYLQRAIDGLKRREQAWTQSR